MSVYPPRCSGDVCAQLTVSAAGTTITAWAFNQTFDGIFEIVGNFGRYTSPGQEWSAGGPGYTFEVPNGRGAVATVTAVGVPTNTQQPGGFGQEDAVLGQVSLNVD